MLDPAFRARDRLLRRDGEALGAQADTLGIVTSDDELGDQRRCELALIGHERATCGEVHRCFKRGILPQYGGLELAQLRTWLDAELADEGASSRPVDRERVAAAVTACERPAQARHSHLQRRAPRGRQLVGPERAEDPVGCDRSVSVYQQQSQQSPLPRAGDDDLLAVHSHLERPEDAEAPVHLAIESTPAPRAKDRRVGDLLAAPSTLTFAQADHDERQAELCAPSTRTRTGRTEPA